jgi:AbiV family abortive infection protein
MHPPQKTADDFPARKKMNLKEFLKTIRTGQLSVDEIGRGMHKNFKNATELIEDADLLLEHRPERAISLAVLALEEIAKIILLANAAARAAKTPVTWKEIEDDLNLRSHKHKQAVFAVYGSAILDKLASVEGKGTYYEQMVPGGLGPLLDYMKQLGFYVDIANGQFISPAEFGADNSEWASWLIAVAKERLITFEPLHGTEERSLNFARKTAELVSFMSGATDDEFKQKVSEYIEKSLKKT